MARTFFAALLLLCIACTVQAQSHECNCDKVTNATQCTDTNQEGASAALQAWMHAPYMPKALDDPNKLQWCKDILKIEVCLFIEFDPWGQFFDNVTVGISVAHEVIWEFETTIPDLFVEDGICVDDNTIFEILLLIPSLRDDAEIFLKILDITGCEPRGLFSMCLLFTPCDSSNADLPCGCFTFDFQLLYLRDYCVVKESLPIGCLQDPKLLQANRQPIRIH